jgi:DNA-binding NarL/FixJ family response regulator
MHTSTQEISSMILANSIHIAFFEAKNRFNLTEREMDTLKYITEGLTNSQIAEKMYVSINTIKYHTRNIYSKLGIVNRTQVAARIYGLP